MEKVFIINAGQTFLHSGGKFNKSITDWSQETLEKLGYETRITDINQDFDPQLEVENYKWADFIIYHIPIWWFQVPFKLKSYIDHVFEAGYQNGLYANDGRSRKNPAINYGTGGLLQGKKYMLTTSWNAPDTAFTLEGEFFEQKSVDEGVMFGFHKMNQFIGMQGLTSFHFHDMEKNASIERVAAYKKAYIAHLNNTFVPLNTNHENLLNSHY